MECPRCGVEMASLTTANADLRHCPTCGGIWFEVNALDRVLDGGLGRLPRVGGLPKEAPPRPACPACATALHEMTTIGPARLRVAACKVCHGRWLDAQELAAARGRGLWGALRRALQFVRPAVSPLPGPDTSPGASRPAT